VTASSRDCRRCREALRLRICGAAPDGPAGAVEAHLAACADCRSYAREVEATAESLRRLGATPVQPSPAFRQRWMAAVQTVTKPNLLAGIAAAFVVCCRRLASRNRRPLLALAPVWMLILFFKITAPDLVPAALSAPPRSPAEIVRALRSPVMIAGRFEPGWVPGEPRRKAPARPRSERPPTQSATQRRDCGGAGLAIAGGGLFRPFLTPGTWYALADYSKSDPLRQS
jgi:hypothetical protein